MGLERSRFPVAAWSNGVPATAAYEVNVPASGKFPRAILKLITENSIFARHAITAGGPAGHESWTGRRDLRPRPWLGVVVDTRWLDVQESTSPTMMPASCAATQALFSRRTMWLMRRKLPAG